MHRALIVAGLVAGCSQSPSQETASTPRPRDAAARPAVSDAASMPPADAEIDVPVDAPSLSIVDAPMAWSAERAELTLAYRRQHSDKAATDLVIDPRVIVLHYTGGGSAKGTRSYFDNPRIEASRKQLQRAGLVNVSSHYVIDRDGTIYRLQPDTRFARHCIGLNHLAIGIENVGDEAKWPLTAAQVAANVVLVRELARTHRITHLLGHHEVMEFRDHAYYVELDPTYKNTKPDPGAAFMTKVRAQVADLGLVGL